MLVYTSFVAVLVNDVHSRLNPTAVERVLRPQCIEDLRAIVGTAAERRSVSICGGRHSMGGQQFAADTMLVDTTGMSAPVGLDADRGLLTIEAGADWRQVIQATHELPGGQPRWAIRQKQTGADALTIGGSISCNAHGRGLGLPPLVGDVESFDLVTATGDLVPVSRGVNRELFPLVVGGYGMFGIIARATLRLMPRRKVRRLVDIIDLDDAVHAIWRRIDQGCLYGDFQYAIDSSDDSFLRRGVMACYQEVTDEVPVDSGDVGLPREAWLKLLALAHRDQREAFRQYSLHYLATHGQVYWSDTMQLSTYIPTYGEFVAKSMPKGTWKPERSLMITELFVPPPELNGFMAAAREILRGTGVQDIYGTIRAIRQDTETFLPWARDDYACIIFNLLTEHTDEGVERTRRACRALIDAAADRNGSFYLTYHRWATREQLLRCHARLPEFLALKHRIDPHTTFDSDWHRWLCRTLDQ
jgi:FAD/FMN-containing dehydrogenase